MSGKPQTAEILIVGAGIAGLAAATDLQAAGRTVLVVDKQMKGISPVPAVTLHATPAFSLEHWDGDRALSGHVLLRAAAPWLGGKVTEFQVHGWRYSKPIQVLPATTLMLSRTPLLFLAGDACGGPRVEGAALSGWAAAEALQQLLSQD